MKRLPQTLTAAALTGALAFGGAAVAQAQIPAPATIVVEGVTYEMQADGSYKAVAGFENSGTDENGNPDAATPSPTKDQAQAIWERQQAENGETLIPRLLETRLTLKAQTTPRVLTPRTPTTKVSLLLPPRKTPRATLGTRA